MQIDIDDVIRFINSCDCPKKLQLVARTTSVRQRELDSRVLPRDGKTRPIGTDVTGNPGRSLGEPAEGEVS